VDYKVSEQTLGGTTRCPFDFVCLDDPASQVCPVLRAIAGDGVFVDSRRECTCPYVVSFGYGHVCTCATRVELYERYRV
jgi:hypothetical protein